MRYRFIDNYNVEPWQGRFFVHEKTVHTNPTDEQLAMIGYKELIAGRQPEHDPETHRVIPIYTDGEAITQAWELKENEEEEDNL